MAKKGLAFALGAMLLATVARADDVVVRPKTHDRHLRNPGMGFVYYGPEDPLPDLADIIFICNTVWGQVEPEEGRFKWDNDEIRHARRIAEKYDRRLAIRLPPSFQNHEYVIPKWLVDKGVKQFPCRPEVLRDFGFKSLLEPEWWNPIYVEAYEKFLKAYAKAFDGDPRLEWIDMRYYGFWGEGHRFNATVPWPKEVDRRKLLTRFIDAHRASFTKTPLVVETARDQDVSYPEGTAIDHALQHGCWMRRDGFGPYLAEEETKLIQARWKESLVIAENGRAYRDHLQLKVSKSWIKDAPPITIEELFDQMLAHHANYFPMGWGGDDFRAVLKERPQLVKKISTRLGYRLVVTEARWPEKARASLVVQTIWRNVGVGRLPFRYAPTLYLLDAKGEALARLRHAEADATRWYDGADQGIRFELALPSGLPAATYRLAVGMTDEEGRARIDLAIEGGDGAKRFVLGEIRVEN